MSKRKCVNCRHNIRIPKKTYVECRCEIDNHYIGYVECFERWCRRWAKDRTFEQENCDGYEYETGACVDGNQDCMDAKIIMTAPVIIPASKEETE